MYYFHVPKTGGSYWSNSVDEIAKFGSVVHHNWVKQGMSFDNIKDKLSLLLSTDFGGRLHVFEHHHHYPPVKEILPLLVAMRNEATKKGFVFEITISVRDVVDMLVSTYNYGIQSHEPAFTSRTFEEMVWDQRNLLATYFYVTTPVMLDQHFEPWLNYQGSFDEMHPEFWMGDIRAMLNQMDYIFVTENLEDFRTYFECHLKIPFREGSKQSTHKITINKTDLSLAIFELIYRLNTLDILLLSEVHKIRENQEICP